MRKWLGSQNLHPASSCIACTGLKHAERYGVSTQKMAAAALIDGGRYQLMGNAWRGIVYQEGGAVKKTGAEKPLSGTRYTEWIMLLPSIDHAGCNIHGLSRSVQ